LDTKIIQNKLLEWYKKEGRHHLPWRNTKELYHIYLSEVMLQQTQVNRVLEEYYPNFLKKFPTLETLAMANEEDVIVAWSGLGYYSRARNLHKTAKLCYKNFPKRFEELIKLPGIGKYTASAMCAFGYKQSVTVLDTNIKRVIKRLFAIEVEDEKIIDQKAYTVLNEKSPREHNLALMDLGSMVCVPKNPKCEGCPLEPFCLGKNDIQRYTKTKKTRYEKLDLFLGIWIKNNKIALKKSTTNMYKNMLVLPEIEPIEENFITDFKHAYTKYNITVHLYRIEEYVEDVIWVDVDDIHNQPIASLTSKAIDRYRKKIC
jgi:A/G-specific adenine glycosylase